MAFTILMFPAYFKISAILYCFQHFFDLGFVGKIGSRQATGKLLQFKLFRVGRKQVFYLYFVMLGNGL